jgi:hypothetical protein
LLNFATRLNCGYVLEWFLVKVGYILERFLGKSGYILEKCTIFAGK